LIEVFFGPFEVEDDSLTAEFGDSIGGGPAEAGGSTSDDGDSVSEGHFYFLGSKKGDAGVSIVRTKIGKNNLMKILEKKVKL